MQNHFKYSLLRLDVTVYACWGESTEGMWAVPRHLEAVICKRWQFCLSKTVIFQLYTFPSQLLKRLSQPPPAQPGSVTGGTVTCMTFFLIAMLPGPVGFPLPSSEALTLIPKPQPEDMVITTEDKSLRRLLQARSLPSLPSCFTRVWQVLTSRATALQTANQAFEAPFAS